MSQSNLNHSPEPISLELSSVANPWVVNREDAPIEGGFDPKYGDVTWQTLICKDRMNSDDLVLGAANIPGNGTLPLHRHDPAEFYFFTSGYGEVMIDGTAVCVRQGSSVFIPGGAEHGIFAGPYGVEFISGFPENRFSDVEYNLSEQQEAEL